MKRLLLTMALLLTATVGMKAQTYITDVMLIGSKDNNVVANLKSIYKEQGWKIIDQNLNAGKSSAAKIYLLVKVGTGSPITDFYIKVGGSSNHPEEISHNGRTYHLTDGDGANDFKNGRCDLNNGAGGDYIYLYYTKDEYVEDGLKRAVTDIWFDSKSSDAVTRNGGTEACDLNKGAGGDYIYMHITTGSADVRTLDVNNENELRSALKDNASVRLQRSFTINDILDINTAVTVSIDLNGYSIQMNEPQPGTDGASVFWVGGEENHAGYATVIIKDSKTNGAIKRGYTGKGGGLWVKNTGTFVFEGGASTECVGYYGGAIYNDGVVNMSGGTITNCIGPLGGGAIYNDGVVNMSGGTITGNTSSVGGGIYNAGTLSMSGRVVVKDNERGNVYLSEGKSITITGPFDEESSIGVTLATGAGTFTNGFSEHFDNSLPVIMFKPDNDNYTVEKKDGELCLVIATSILYVERSWDAGTLTVSEQDKYRNGPSLLYSDNSNANAHLGGWYVVASDVSFKKQIKIDEDTYIILGDDMTLTASDGIYIPNGKTLTIYGQKKGNGKIDARSGEKAGIGDRGNGGGHFVMHGGVVYAVGGLGGAGIGNSEVTVYGGTLFAKGNFIEGVGGGGAGIGANREQSQKYPIRIYGGNVECYGQDSAAAIGGGMGGNGGPVYIGGGRVIAITDAEHCIGAAIGGGGNSDSHGKYSVGKHGGHGGDVIITGGYVYAKSSGTKEGGAGIGGGGAFKDGGDGGKVLITGGEVVAIGGPAAPGIGPGFGNCSIPYYTGSNVTIEGGKVTAYGGKEGDKISPAIGAGLFDDHPGTLNISPNMKVAVGKTEDRDDLNRLKGSDNWNSACFSKRYVEIEECDHEGATYTISSPDPSQGHFRQCVWCKINNVFEEHKIPAITGKCDNCGWGEDAAYCDIMLIQHNGSDYFGVNVMVVEGSTYTMPACISIPEGYMFAGWSIAPDDISSMTPAEGETLHDTGEQITVTGNMRLVARYKSLNILLDEDSPVKLLYEYDGRKTASVTLAGRTIYRDGTWNTLCLPFDVADFTGTPLEGAVVETLASSAFDAETGRLTLNFTDPLTSVEAGKPYIVKWNGDQEDIYEPTFYGVTINYVHDTNVETDVVTFHGLCSSMKYFEENRSILYLGANNTLYYPSGAFTIGSFRALFLLLKGIVAGDPSDPNGVKAFNLNFGDETMGITNTNSANESNAYYSIDGRKLDGKPTQKGVYIHNGKKVVQK